MKIRNLKPHLRSYLLPPSEHLRSEHPWGEIKVKPGTHPRGEPQGFTILEILLTFTILGIISVILVTFVFNSYKSFHKGEDYARLQNDSVAASMFLEKELRATTEVVSPSSTTLTIRAYAVSSSSPPDEVRYFLENGQLKRGLIPPTGSPPDYTYDPADETIKIIGNNVISSPLFEYFDQDGTQLTSPVPAASVTLIKVNLTIDDDSGKPPEAISTSFKIQLRNLKTNN